jgi:hypothetical protein
MMRRISNERDQQKGLRPADEREDIRMTYLQATALALKWFILTVGTVSAAGGLVWVTWRLIPAGVKKRIFEED